jgi:serine/threonine-protein phosphatase 6 regulatory subunit 3
MFLLCSFVARLLNRALEDQASRSTLVHSLTVCISLLDPKRFVMAGMSRQQISDSLPTVVSAETIAGMLPRLG